jgi:hypothetical protein
MLCSGCNIIVLGCSFYKIDFHLIGIYSVVYFKGLYIRRIIMKLFLKKVLFSSLSLLLVFASLAGCSGANKDSPSSAGTSS